MKNSQARTDTGSGGEKLTCARSFRGPRNLATRDHAAEFRGEETARGGRKVDHTGIEDGLARKTGHQRGMGVDARQKKTTRA